MGCIWPRAGARAPSPNTWTSVWVNQRRFWMPAAAPAQSSPPGRAKSNAPGLTTIQDWSRMPLGDLNPGFGLWLARSTSRQPDLSNRFWPCSQHSNMSWTTKRVSRRSWPCNREWRRGALWPSSSDQIPTPCTHPSPFGPGGGLQMDSGGCDGPWPHPTSKR